MAVHAPHQVRQQGGRGRGTGRSGHRPRKGHDQGEEGGRAEHAAVRAGRAAGEVGSRGQRHPDVRISLPEQGVSADHAQHFQLLRQPPSGGARLRSSGQGRQGPQHAFEVLLSYEYQVRKAAIKKGKKGHSGALPDHSTGMQQLGGHQEQVKEPKKKSGRASLERTVLTDGTRGSPRERRALQVQQSTGEVPGPCSLPQVPGVSPAASVSSQPQRRGEGRDPALRTTGGSGWARGAGAHLQRATPLRRGKEVINRQPIAKDDFKGGLQGALGGTFSGTRTTTSHTMASARVSWSRSRRAGVLWGYPWLSEKLQKRADEGNILLGTTWCDLIARRPTSLGEHPEDLGGASG